MHHRARQLGTELLPVAEMCEGLDPHGRAGKSNTGECFHDVLRRSGGGESIEQGTGGPVEALMKIGLREQLAGDGGFAAATAADDQSDLPVM